MAEVHGTIESILHGLKEHGFKLLVDDFGTGYSSLSYLHRFPMDTIKVDGSFVRRITEQGKHAEIVRAIVLLAKTLSMDVIAECVETKEQNERLVELGCESAQGYFFSRPVEPAAAQKFVSGELSWFGQSAAS